ncbi:hypothetical protein IWW36_002694 [Coemansia brasiliensis]|uniref:Amino acid transporter transmembrane domain-containing protein n=1 Tax=Coemansia brasiliensis TaxID=2650707 RepID=A0A9W8LZM9_9FUNG|nr:hypothetical protein IWW36_002694 [Coemansia brasiliensis]
MKSSSDKSSSRPGSCNAGTSRSSARDEASVPPESLRAWEGAGPSADVANRALRQYLLTEDEASELASSDAGYNGQGADSRCRSDDGDIEDNDETGLDAQVRGGDNLADPLQLLSGYITYDMYKWHRDHKRGMHSKTPSRMSNGEVQASQRRHSRVQSLSAYERSAIQSDGEWDLPLTHAQIVEPGGFRRHYIHQQAEDEGRTPNILTANFVDFLALFGHFAGGDYPSDEDDDTESDNEQLEADLVSVGADTSAAYAGGMYGSTGESSRAAGSWQATESGNVRASLIRKKQQAGTAAVANTASVRKTFFLLLKSFIGSAVLFLPRAFYNGGLAFSIGVMMVVAGISLYTLLLLVRCYERVHCGYGEMGRRLYGKWMERVVLMSIVTSQLGFSCAGVIFVATNLRDLFNAVTKCQWRLTLDVWVVIQMVLLVPLCLVRHIKGLSGIALLADVFIVVGLVYVWTMDVSTLAHLGMGHVQNFNPENYALFLGSAAYTFEGYALILPIVDSMRQPEKFPRVLTLVMLICGAVAITTGALSYSAYGDRTEAIILLNMPSNTLITLTVQLLYSLAILFTTPLMMFPVIRILEQALFPRRSGKRNRTVKMQKNFFRTLLLALVMVVSVVGVERVDRLVAIIGGFACIPLSFIYPPLFHLRAAAVSRWERVRDIVLAALGVVVCFYVTRGAINRWGISTPPYDFCDAV